MNLLQGREVSPLDSCPIGRAGYLWISKTKRIPLHVRRLQRSVSSLLQCFYRLLQSLSLRLRVTKSGQMQSAFHSSTSLHTAWVILGNGLKEMADWGGIKNTSNPKITKVHQRVNGVLYLSPSRKYLEYLAKQSPELWCFSLHCAVNARLVTGFINFLLTLLWFCY